MQRFTGLHTGLVVLIILAFLLTACGGDATPDPGAIAAAVGATLTALPQPTKEEATPTPEPPGCLDRPDSQQWLQDVEALLDVWRDEVELVMQASRITAAESSRELRNVRRQLRQMETPLCLVQVRDQLMFQMTGGLTSLDAWIQDDGDGTVFAAVAELRLDEFLRYAVLEDRSAESCDNELDEKWVSETESELLLWTLTAWDLSSESPNVVVDLAMDADDCTKILLLRPISVWMQEIRAKLRMLRAQGEVIHSRVEIIDHIFAAIVREYSELHVTE